MPIEDVSRIEPCLLETLPPSLADVIAMVPAEAQKLGHALHADSAASLAELMRLMNCYYTNLIEGHHTRPKDIERALAGNFDSDRERRDLQREARAHVAVQRLIDERHRSGELGDPASVEFARWTHREFYREVPAALRKMGQHVVEPGEWRKVDNAVGRHQPPASERVPEFMDYFAERFRFDRLSPSMKLVAIGSAHHRFNYIHPFLDGNGRVSRLMSHAMCLQAGIGAHGLWSISRGLARGLESRGDYKRLMDATDAPREGDFDGRGNLSSRRLEELVTWFLKVCLDQIRYVGSLLELDQLRARLARWVEQQGLKGGAARLLDEIARRGEIDRGEAAVISRTPERTARVTLGALQKRGIVASRTPKGAVSLRFTLDHADTLLPRLFTET